MTERCGCWVTIGDYPTWCARDVDHKGECLPLRSDAMNRAEQHEASAQAIYDAVTAIDQDGGWPYEGPDDERAGSES